MKIIEIKTYLLKKKLSSTMQISRGGFAERTHAIVQVITDEGITGLGEGVGDAPLISEILKSTIAPLAIDLDPFNIQGIRQKLIDSQVYLERKGSAICAVSAIEMACWDIKGKALNLPVHQLLGGKIRENIPAYASDLYWEENPKNMADNASRISNLGFTCIKAHLGVASPRQESKRIEAIREAIGPNVELKIDLNGGYDFFQARQAIKAWEPYDLFWLEEPLSPNHVKGLANLRNHSSIPIAAGENEFRTHGFKHLFDNMAVDIAMPDIGRVGGLEEAKNICVLADAYGIPVSPHNYSSGILLAATLHLMANSANTCWLEIDTSNNPIYQEFLVKPLEMENGLVTIPNQPGLGVELKQDILTNYLNK